MSKRYLGSRVDESLCREIDLLKRYYPSRSAVIEDALENGLRFLKKNNLKR
jgi:metal-responsive CopG/Arc/MetJ family transcriptional regulator